MIVFASQRRRRRHKGLQEDVPRMPRRDIPTISLDQLLLGEQALEDGLTDDEESDGAAWNGNPGSCIVMSSVRRRGFESRYDDTLEDRYDDATAAPPEECQTFQWI